MEMGGGTNSPPLQTAVDTEQIRNLEECETYDIHVSGTKHLHKASITVIPALVIGYSHPYISHPYISHPLP